MDRRRHVSLIFRDDMIKGRIARVAMKENRTISSFIDTYASEYLNRLLDAKEKMYALEPITYAEIDGLFGRPLRRVHGEGYVPDKSVPYAEQPKPGTGAGESVWP